MSIPFALLVALWLQEQPHSTPAQSSEHVSIGGGGAFVLVMPCFLPTVRVSVPLHRRLAIDADVGPALFWGNREIGQIPDGRAVDAQIRWMRKDRKSNGMGRYWLFGASHAQGRRITRGVVGREYAYRNLQFGYEWDQLVNGFRTGIEFKVSPVGDGEGHARLFVVWGRR